MAVNKVVYGETTVIDITDSTVTASKLKSGETAYGADGQKVTGTLVVPEVLDDLTDVVITTPQTAQEIYFDGTNWINYGAKIVLTFDDDFKGQTITLAKGQTTITKTAPLSGNTMNLYVNETGTWTISSTISGDTYETEVNVTTFGTSFDAELVIGETVPQGSTVTPTDDIQIWLACANLDKPYTTLEAVLADRETFETLIADSNACDYMARSTTWASDTTDDADAMSLIGKYDYCSNALLSNATWAEAIANSDYFEEVLNVKVPKMTSNTTPSGECISNVADSSSYYKYYAFDQNTSTAWAGAQSGNSYIGYKFTQQVVVDKAYFKTGNYYVRITSIKVQGSNDNFDSDIHDLSESITPTSDETTINLSSVGSYQYYRLYMSINAAPIIYEVQFYGRASKEVLVPLVPTMTSDTTPSGECIGGLVGGGSLYTNAYKAFDNDTVGAYKNSDGTDIFIGYKFDTAKIVNGVSFSDSSNGSISYSTFKIQASNDNSTWDDLTSEINRGTSPTSVDFENNIAYLYYRIYLKTRAGYWIGIAKLQFYAKTVQTNIVHSCANDTIYYMEEGSPVIVATTNSDGDGVLDFSSLEDKEYTFYSSVAKDPSNLSNDFSKTIRITKSEFGGTTEMYLMPDTVKTLYWWGYKSDDCEELNTANGWSIQNTPNGFLTPTYNTNDIYVNGGTSGSQYNCAGVGSKIGLSGTIFHTVSKSTTLSGSKGVFRYTASNKALNLSGTSSADAQSTTNTIEHLNYALTSGYYASCYVSNSRVGNIYALWYE